MIKKNEHFHPYLRHWHIAVICYVPWVAGKPKSIFSQILKTIETNWHYISDYANFEILFNFEKTAENIKIIVSESASIINLCEICAFIKIHKLIFKRFDHDESINAFLKKRNSIWFNKFQITMKTTESIILHVFILKQSLSIRI